MLLLQRGDLLSQGQVLEDQLLTRRAHRTEEAEKDGHEKDESAPHVDRSVTPLVPEDNSRAARSPPQSVAEALDPVAVTPRFGRPMEF